MTRYFNFYFIFLKFFYFFFAATADVYRNEGNEAFKKGDFINAIHFYTKGIKMNCNEKELKAKLHNNRAIAHSKLGKMMRALIGIFFHFEAIELSVVVF